MKTLAPAAWVAIGVFVITVASCAAMIWIAQKNAWSPQTVTTQASSAEPRATLEADSNMKEGVPQSHAQAGGVRQ